MELNDYQKQVMASCTASSNNFAYMMLGLVGKVGELSADMASNISSSNCAVNFNEIYVNDRTPELTVQIQEAKEMLSLGEILLQLAGLCAVRGYTLEGVAQVGLSKQVSQGKKPEGSDSDIDL